MTHSISAVRPRSLLVASAVAILLSLLAVLPAFADANVKQNLVQDCSAGCVEALDMAGPTGFGFLSFNQDASGDLRVTASLKGASPNTEYPVYLVCGSTHALACGFIQVGTLTTNGQGNGTLTVHVSVATLQDTPFGPGDRTDHIDLIGTGSGDVYVVSNVNYTVPAI